MNRIWKRMVNFLLHNTLLQHALALVLLVLWFWALTNVEEGVPFQEELVMSVSILIPAVLASFACNRYLLSWIKQKKYLRVLGGYILILALTTLVYHFIESGIFGLYCHMLGCVMQELVSTYGDRIALLLTVTILGMALRISRDTLLQENRNKELELTLLKSQLNPGFLLTTLEKFSHLARGKQDELPGLMLKLSDLLRYNLYETSDAWVSLEREYQSLQNFLALRQVASDFEVQLERAGDFTSSQIVPMTLIGLLEDAFNQWAVAQHKVRALTLQLELVGGVLYFECTWDTALQIPVKTEEGGAGIELSTMTNRLNQLYPHQHSLELDEHTQTMGLVLKLQEEE